MKIKADGVEYDLPTAMTLGELRTLKRHFDLARPAEMDMQNIDHLCGVLFIAKKRVSPNMDDDALIKWVDAVAKMDLVQEDSDVPEPAEDPSDADEAPAPAGK